MNPVKAALQSKQQRPTPYSRPVVTLQQPAANPRSPSAAASTSFGPSTDTTIPVNDLVQLARKSFSQKEFDVSLQYLSRALALAPQNINLLDSRATCFEKMARLSDGLVDAKAMIRLYPQNPKVRYLARFCYVSSLLCASIDKRHLSDDGA